MFRYAFKFVNINVKIYICLQICIVKCYGVLYNTSVNKTRKENVTMKRLLALFTALIMTACTFSVSADSGVTWNGENSIIVTVSSDTDRDFTPSDFPELDCTDITVVSKKAENGCFTYELILQIDLGEGSIKEAMDAVAKNSEVSAVSRNLYDYLDPILLLTETTLTIRVGESADVGIDYFDTYNSGHFYYGVIFSVDESVDISNADNSTFGFDFRPIKGEADMHTMYEAFYSEYYEGDLVGDNFEESPINKYYFSVDQYGVGGENAYQIIEAVNTVLSKDGIIAAEPFDIEYPCARMPSELWSVADEIVSLSLSGGKPVGIPENLIGQTATVTGVYAGTTTLTLSSNDNSQGASASCVIKVINSGDANDDGKLNNLDASEVLKYDAGLVELSAEKLEKCDMNNDGYVNNLDASFILKYDAGLI